MPTGSQRHKAAVFLTIASLSIALVAVLPAVASARLADRIIAVVNSDLIMLSDVMRELKSDHVRIEPQHQNEDLPQRLKTAQYMALTKLIERTLQLQEAKAKKVEVSDLEVKQAAEQMSLQGAKFDPSNPEDQRSIRDQLLLMKVVDREVRGNIMVGESEMKRYYEEHRDRFALPDEFLLSQIFVPRRADDEAAEALAKIRKAMDDLKRGEKFEDVALRYSDGPDALQGGRLGLVRRGELLPSIEQAIAQLVPGGISNIIENTDGFRIIRLDEKKPKQYRSFEEVKYEIQGLVFEQKAEEVFQSWLTGLKNKAYIEIKF